MNLKTREQMDGFLIKFKNLNLILIINELMMKFLLTNAKFMLMNIIKKFWIFGWNNPKVKGKNDTCLYFNNKIN